MIPLENCTNWLNYIYIYICGYNARDKMTDSITRNTLSHNDVKVGNYRQVIYHDVLYNSMSPLWGIFTCELTLHMVQTGVCIYWQLHPIPKSHLHRYMWHNLVILFSYTLCAFYV